MSTKPALQTQEDLLEDPDLPQAQRGLVSRYSVMIFVLMLVLALAAFAFYDLTKKPASSSSGTASGTVNSTPIAAVGPSPQEADVRAIAEAQASKSVPTGQPPQAGTPFDGAPIPPADARITPRVGSPVDLSNKGSATTTTTDIAAAKAERDGAAAESGIFAAGVSAATDPAAGSIESMASGITDPLTRQIADATRALSRPVSSPVDPTAEMIRALGASQPKQEPVRQGRDESWLTGQATTTTAEAVYAKTPVSPFMVFQGTRVPLVTREAINSDLPGQVTAMSTSPIYDSINQCAVLIPAATKFIGAYSPDIRPGQTRLLLSYRRMIFPDGRSVDLDGAQGVDQMGSAGAEADVNNHFLKMFGYGFAMAIIGDRIGGKTNVSVRNSDGSTSTTSIAGQVFGDIANRALSRNAVIPPTLTLPHGTQMFVTIVRDIALTPTSRNNCK